MAEIGYLVAAQGTAAAIETTSLKNMAYASVAGAMIDAGKLNEAKGILYSLPIDVRKYVHYDGMTEALRKLAIAQAEGGDLSGAKDTRLVIWLCA